MMRGWQIEWGKLALILLLMVGGFTLVLVALLADLPDDRFAITLALGSSVISAPMGYLFGNGRLASKGEFSVPTLAPPAPPADYRRPDAGGITVGTLCAWLIIAISMLFALAGMSYLGGAVVCSF